MSLLVKLFGHKSTHLPIGSDVGDITTKFEMVQCHGKHARQVFNKLKETPDRTPVALGATRSVEMHHEDFGTSKNPQDILDAAKKFDFAVWLEQHKNDWAENSQDGEEWPMRGEFNVQPQTDDPLNGVVVDVLSNTYLPAVYIGLFNTDAAWKVPAHLDVGGWNAFPNSEEHVAIQKRWFDTYGAVLVGHSHDVLTFHVANPPTTKEEAYALAYEQYAYCEDVIDQGFGTLDALAGSLLNASSWYFWWD